jgi:hypothetical protein
MRAAVFRRSTTVFLAFSAFGAAVVLLPRADYRQTAPQPKAPKPAVSAIDSASLPFTQLASATPEPDAGAGDALEGDDTNDAGAQMPDGGAVPELSGAPKSVTFGVVLVSYAGAQGAPRTARSKADAQKLAAELAELAKTDFEAAVKKGDLGSIADAGKMYRGIVEPAPEYVLFSLEPDQVGGPVDTPRGFWIVRRIK